MLQTLLSERKTKLELEIREKVILDDGCRCFLIDWDGYFCGRKKA
jgi:hypothetical protein